MGKGIGLIAGATLTALGVIGIVVWWSAVVIIIKAGLAIAAFLIGLGAIIFGLGELRSSAETSPVSALPPKTEAKPAEPSGGDTMSPEEE